MENTKIEWCATTGPDGTVYPGHTFNPWWGCQKVSPACKHCYAADFANRFHPGLWGPAATTPRKIASEDYWKQPIKWDVKAKQLGIKLKVFCASMADVFEEHRGVEEARIRLWNLIVATPNLNWLLLTKRPENIMNMIPSIWWGGLPQNIWVGTTVENQEYADERIPHLLRVSATVRFLSMEPLCGPVDLRKYISWDIDNTIDWVIAGGESGRQASPSHPDWFRSLRDQCDPAGVPFFFKQWGELLPDCQVESAMPGLIKSSARRLFPSPNNADKINTYHKIGKHKAGRLLDGIEHNDMPG